ncbi:transmembrane protein C16orf54 homolog isoform X2 [Cavia porcellus]|nr:transmembrane protein C16orf54 homolog isoform X2 [Cavia porcellus]XP_012997314.1 transmembrane protein C16orf54 homolog isoform X2 [Cavia porcellus]XP_023416476.1 transmembrane protein C16orf54 homolog isoform X2 [Cavia porcellus]
MPSTSTRLTGHMEGPPATEATFWPPLPCGPCIPILLALASLAAFFILTTAVLAERLFRRSLHPDPSHRVPTLVWRPGGELWIEPAGTARERSEDWYGCEEPLLTDRSPDFPPPGGTLEARASAPPAPSALHSSPSSSVPQEHPNILAQSTFWGPQPCGERPPTTGLVSWVGPELRPEATPMLGSATAWRPRPGSPEPDWSLQPRVTLEQIAAFWRREGRTSVSF